MTRVRTRIARALGSARRAREGAEQRLYAIGPVTFIMAEFTIKVNPEPSNAPGAGGLQKVVNGIAVYALIAAAIGFLVSAITAAIATRTSNDMFASGGKIGMVTSAAVAFLVGLSAGVLNLAYTLGKGG